MTRPLRTQRLLAPTKEACEHGSTETEDEDGADPAAMLRALLRENPGGKGRPEKGKRRSQSRPAQEPQPEPKGTSLPGRHSKLAQPAQPKTSLSRWKGPKLPPVVLATLAGVLAAVVVTTFVLVASRAKRAPSPTAEAAPTSTTPARNQPKRATGRCSRAEPPEGADVDGDGCREAISYKGGILEAGGRRYQLGQAGDQLLMGDWDCDGHPTPVLFRPSTQELFNFNGWATRGVDLTVSPAAVAPGATGAQVKDVEGDGCDEVLVSQHDGQSAVVRLGGPAAASASESAPGR